MEYDGIWRKKSTKSASWSVLQLPQSCQPKTVKNDANSSTLFPGFSVHLCHVHLRKPAKRHIKKMLLNSKHQWYITIFSIFTSSHYLWYWKKPGHFAIPWYSRFQLDPRWFLLETTICFHHPHPISIVPVTREAALLLLEPPWSEMSQNWDPLRPWHESEIFLMKRLGALQSSDIAMENPPFLDE